VWEIEGTDQFADWFGPLSRADKVRVEAAIERLEEEGPGLGRPWVDSLVGSKVKELRPRGGYLRILFRFDPRKTGILLMAGNKEGLWSSGTRRRSRRPRGSTKPTSPNCGEKDY